MTLIDLGVFIKWEKFPHLKSSYKNLGGPINIDKQLKNIKLFIIFLEGTCF